MRDDNSLPGAEKLNSITPPKSPRRPKTVSQFGTDLSNTFTPYKKKGHPHPALIKGVIGSTEHTGKACPCCRRYVPRENGRVSNVPGIIGSHSYDAAEQQQQQQVQSNKPDDMNMKIKQVVVKGWLHKKGSGQDILGTTSWKPRWAELVLAQKNGYNVDVPILMIYWHPSLPMPSTSITLDSHIVMPIDEGTSEWDKYRFDIVPAKNNVNTPDEVKSSTRSFTAPLSQRNQWVYVLNFVLFEYEKRKAKDRSTRVLRESRRARLPQLPPSPRRVARSASPTTRQSHLPFHANEARTNLDFNPVAIHYCPSLP